MDVDVEAFELVLLHRPATLPGHDEETLARLQGEHLAFCDRLRDLGQVVTNGPVLDQPDECFRGLSFFRTGSLEAARQLAESDPSVVAGRLAVTVTTWSMVRSGRPVTIA